MASEHELLEEFSLEHSGLVYHEVTGLLHRWSVGLHVQFVLPTASLMAESTSSTAATSLHAIHVSVLELL